MGIVILNRLVRVGLTEVTLEDFKEVVVGNDFHAMGTSKYQASSVGNYRPYQRVYHGPERLTGQIKMFKPYRLLNQLKTHTEEQTERNGID